MGRELKRVSLDFDWPSGMVWKGYLNPYHSQECKACGATGHNPATKQIADDWYDFADTGKRWCNNITQDEVDALIKGDRLYDFTKEFVPGEGWKPIKPPPIITAEMVNVWSRDGMGHDAINRWICVEVRAKRIGVWGSCGVCGGDGEIWLSDKIESLSEGWYENERYDPPIGEGYQVWETVSEGSPKSPVLETSDQIIEWLVGEGHSRKGAEEFISSEWAMSGVLVGGKFVNGIDALGELAHTPREPTENEEINKPYNPLDHIGVTTDEISDHLKGISDKLQGPTDA